MSKEIYFDNAATTMTCDLALEIFLKYSKELYYNTSSAYTPAVKVEKAIYDAQKKMLSLLNAQKGKILFTSGGTESDNLAILGAAKRSRKKHIITSVVEHPAVLNTFKALENEGYEVTYLSVDSKGFINAEDLAQAIYNETFLVSIMHVNNETGAVQDIEKFVQIAKEANDKILFHSDGVQAYGKIPVDLDDLGVDMYSFSSHKIHGPKGVGALYVRDEKKIAPISYGGGHQAGMRAGTINSPGILAFAQAFELAAITSEQDEKLAEIKSYIAHRIKEEIKDSMCINEGKDYSSHILNIAFKDVNAETLLHTCQYAGLILSTGAACSSKKNVVSHTLSAMKLHSDYIGGAVRLSFSRYNTMEEAQRAVDIIKTSVEKLRKYTR